MDTAQVKGHLKSAQKDVLPYAIAGAAILTAHFGGDVKIIPECMKILDDGLCLHSLRKSKASRTTPNTIMVKRRMCGEDSDGPSPVTIEYLRSRRKKKMAGAATTAGGTAGSAVTAGVNVGGIVKEANASWTTGFHLQKLEAIRRANLDDEHVQNWLRHIERTKGAKALIRGTKLAGSSIPHGSIVTTIIAEIGKLGVDKEKETWIKAISMELHYFATTGEGAAYDIVNEIFTKRGLTKMFGDYKVDTIIREPAGWMAISDKIGLI